MESGRSIGIPPHPGPLPEGEGDDRNARSRHGFSLLEFEVALVVLGIALTGIFPLVVMHSKALESLERRSPTAGQWYVVPSTNEWARKLGAAAALTTTDPGPKPQPPITLVDDGDTGYAESGSRWSTDENPAAFQGHQHRDAPPPAKIGNGNGNANGKKTGQQTNSDYATWTFTTVAPGWYFVEATWLPSPDQAADARYTIYDGDTLLDDTTANQQAAPAGPVYAGAAWQVLTKQYLRNGTVRVRLDGSADGCVAADGMRIVPVANDVQVLSLQRSLNSEEVTAHVSVTVQATP